MSDLSHSFDTTGSVKNMNERAALVIGAGVQGLSTGIVLAETGWRVRIRTDERPENTTSAVAGAIWGPALLQPAERVLGWVTRTYEEFVSLAENPSTGVHLAEGRMAARFDLGDFVPPEARVLPDLRRCEDGELPEGFVSGYRATLPVIDMPRYLGYLVERFRAAGGEMVLSPVPSLADAADDAPVVVNCAGIGAHELVGDPGVYPVRGQNVVVSNPGIREYFIELASGTDLVAYVPHGDRLVLGGVSVEHDWNRVPSRETTEAILRRCADIEPMLTDAEVREEIVGLRPGRNSVRLDSERYRGSRVVHNYGHVGCGVSLSWGCAIEAAQLAADGPDATTGTRR